MKLYFARGACSLTVRIIINEIGLKFDYEQVDLQTKITATGADFLKINPKGTVPVIELDNGEILTENAVIIQYLADSNNATKLLPKVNDFKRYRVLEWLNYVATELHKTISVLFKPQLSEDMKEFYRELIIKKITFVNNRLEQNDYLVGADFTLPDAYLFVMITWLLYLKFDLKQWPNLHRLFGDLSKRPSIHQSMVQERPESK